jgi:hypothetical protein
MTTESLANTTERLRCKAIKKDGQLCRAWAQGSGLCVFHSPESKEARRKGGFNSSKKARADKLLPLRLRPILTLLEQAITEVHEGKIDSKQATAMASLGGAIVRVYESGVLEERLTDLENKASGGTNEHKRQT